jgi:DNA-binding CsgD family transcriptional regulator/tetratricopeptide (TPR) repeat protein/predicted Ser/Thr protein kinase
MQSEMEPLNPREIEILGLIADGMSNREIAAKLHLSQETVKWYNKQLFAKLGAASRTQAVSIAKKQRLLTTMPVPSLTVAPSLTRRATDLLLPAEQNRYQLGEELGRGGMGIIYQAEDTLLHRAVAVKILSGEITAEGRRQLQREAQAAASLNHPNIVSIFDAGEMNGLPFIVMELVTGATLDGQKPAGLDQTIQIALQICAALDHAHAKGIVHRDLKPENIILTDNNQVKILDFGLARRAASRLSDPRSIAGSVFYLAPEQALGEEIDGRADLYSLGVILFELITGHLPFSGEDSLSVISQHLYAPVVAPSTFRVEAAPIEPVILRLLAKNPRERYDTAGQVMEALQSVSGAAVDARQAEPAQAVTLLNQLARGRLVGRRGEMNQLRELWARARQGHGHLALVSGEPGIGKTRLANELVIYAQLSGAMILRGGCYEYEATTPYLPFVEAVREWVHLQPAEVIRSLMGDTASELARLAPEIVSKLGPLPPNLPLPPGEERLRLFDHATRFLQNLAKSSGLLLFIDDLHWADQGTLSLLSYALRNLRSDRVIILAAYREIELDRKHPLAAALVEWNRERLATRVSLERFTFDETAALLATLFGQETISEDLTVAMYAETEGNPFFIEEVVKALIEQGQIFRENNQWERKAVSELAIPQSVKEAIGRRLNRLTETCLDVLHAAAALGKEFDFNELAAIQLLNEDRLLDALDEASTAQLIKAKDGEAFLFTHDKIREVLYEEINPIRRKRLHQRIGEALEKRSQLGNQAYIQELAHHFTESGDMVRSLKYSILAAEEASRMFALDDALQYYEIAHEAAESLNQTGQLAAIHKAIGEIHSQRGQVNQSVDYFQRAIDLETNPEQRGAIKARMGSVYASAGDARGLGLIEEALHELNPETQADEVALATAMIARYYHYRCIHSKAIEYLERARLIAEPLDHSETISQIYAYLAGAYQHMTRYKESMAWAWKNIELGQRKNDPISEAFGYEFLAEDSYALGDWKATLHYADLDLEIGQKIGARDRVAWATYCQAMAKHGQGDLAAAEKDALSTREIAENSGDTRLVILAGALIVQVQADLGKDEEAGILGEQVLQEAEQIEHINMRVIARYSYAYALLQQNRIERALELYLQSDQLIRPTENLWMPMNFRPWLAQVYFDTGRFEDAAGMAENALQLAHNAGSRFNEALALRVQAQVLAETGDEETAFVVIQASLSILDETESRLELGRSLITRGKIQQRRGDPQSAAADWTQALELFTSLGALSSATKAKEQLETV